jgi:dihydrofolate reductase
MRQLTADLFCTVDGFAAGTRSKAYFGYGGPGLDAWVDAELAQPQLILMGANTYRMLAGFAASGDAQPGRMDELPKAVFSGTLEGPLTWANTTLIRDELATAVQALKRQAGDPLRVIGSLSLVRSLLRLGEVDRLRILLFPQLLGETGAEPAFGGLGLDVDLQLAATQVLDERLVLLEYAPAPNDPTSVV